MAINAIFLSRLEQVLRSTRIRATMLLLCSLTVFAPDISEAANRSLTLYNTHTKETATIVYKRGNRFDADGLRKMNRFLRDWRRNEITQMDPNLFDLIWEVYRKTGAKKPIHVVSGYRSPATNKMLRSRSRGVAKASRHTKGQALDFYLPGVSVKKIREIGMLMQAGGVGYYPSSRNPFVHIDTGNVRHWPRMTRKQLVRLFPRGDTVHVPSDRKPLKRYQTAKLKVQKKKTEMDRAARSVGRFTQYAKAAPSRPTQVASLSKPTAEAKPGLLQNLLSRGPKAPPAPTSLSNESPTPALKLASLPKPRAPQSNVTTPDIMPFGPETPDLPAGISEPIVLTSLPKPRLAPTFMTASIGPENTPPTALQNNASESEAAPSPTAANESLEQAASNEILLASLPSAAPSKDFAPISSGIPDELRTEEKITQNGAAILASLTDADNNSPRPVTASLTQSAYAPVRDEQFTALPTDAPRSQQSAIAADEGILRKPQAKQVVKAPRIAPKANRSTVTIPKPSDQLARLTFAYGPSGMGHITNLSQQTKTASFARLSRPLPSSLKGLVSKPQQVIDQGFNKKPLSRNVDTRFAGPVFVKMAMRRFN